MRVTLCIAQISVGGPHAGGDGVPKGDSFRLPFAPKLVSALLALLLLGPAVAGAQQMHQTPAGAEVGVPAASAGWRMIDGGDETGCAFGTPYSFFYRPGADPTRLLIYFQGGGACWSWVSCSGMFDTSVERSELAELRGIFDFANPENPFRDYSTLFVPYCTGDVHVGTVERTYGDHAGTPRHRAPRRPQRDCGVAVGEGAPR